MLENESYITLATFRKNGQPVWTPLWFAEQGGKLYVMTRSDSWKVKRLRNNPRVLFAASSARGKIKGQEYKGTARIMGEEEGQLGRRLIRKKYILARLPIWSRKNIYLEITPE